MKQLYWQPHKISRLERCFTACLALTAIFFSEHCLAKRKQPLYEEKMAAAQLAARAFAVIKAERLKRQIPIDPESDPAGSGLIGQLMSHITSDSGNLQAKQTSINPNFAAAMVQMLRRANVHEGDVIAIGLSGSFPALNIATFAAVQTLRLRPVVIASAAASQWGANHPEFSWLEMEEVLLAQGIFSFRSVAASRGGIHDQALGTSQAGREVLDKILMASGLEVIRASDIDASINRRLAIYRQHFPGKQVKLYMNIGGGSVSVGTHIGKKAFKPGFNDVPPHELELLPSVMASFIKAGTPVLHVVQIVQLARRFGFPVAPTKTPPVGRGEVFVRYEYNRLLAAILLACLITTMILLLRAPRQSSVLPWLGKQKNPPPA